LPRFRLFALPIFLTLSCLSSAVIGQQWSGLLSPNRAANWSNAGAGSIPARSSICQTLGVAGQSASYAQTVTASQIIAALQACGGSNQAVYLNPGTYTMTSTLFGGATATPSNVTLRGASPNQTILNWTATSNNCNGINATAFCIFNGDSGALQYSANVVQWSGGYSQGTTSITLGTAYTGGLSNLKVGALMALGQADTGYSGYAPIGSATDNGNWFNCGQIPPAAGAAPCTWGGNSNAFANAAQTQIVTVTGIAGSTVTFTPAIYAPNWSSAQSPFVFFSSTLPVTGFGVEDLQLNTQSLGDIQAMLETLWATNSWVKDVSFINSDATGAAARKHAEISSSAHITIRDSYMFGSSNTSEGYGIDFLWGTSDSLAENNIAHHMASAYITETGIGNVFGYNYAADNFYDNGAPNWQQCDRYHHNEADYYNLTEGHEGICAYGDDGHGTSFGETFFRNYFSGFDPAVLCPGGGTSCGTGSAGPKSQNTMAFAIQFGSRYWNIVANVLGNGTYQNTYQNQGKSGSPTSCPAYPWTVIYSLNFGNGNQTPFSPTCQGSLFTLVNDPLVSASLMRWGNYDTVNASVQTNSAETASSASTYPGLSSPSTTWSSYPSFYLSSKPAWWGSMPWPAVGPDVTGGNIASVGGHAWHNPAANCFLNVLGGKADGSSGPLNFAASSCYTNTASAGGPPPPSNLTSTVVQ
jgi:hypothetical protein